MSRDKKRTAGKQWNHPANRGDKEKRMIRPHGYKRDRKINDQDNGDYDDSDLSDASADDLFDLLDVDDNAHEEIDEEVEE